MILFIKKIIFIFYLLSFILFNHSVLAIDDNTESVTTEVSEEVIEDEAVDDPFGDSLPSAPDPEPEQSENSLIQNIENLESGIANVSSIEAYKLLNYMFSGTIIRSKNNRKAIIVTPNQDQYVLAVGDYFSSEDAIIKEINADEVIVIDQNAEEYFFKVGRTGKKKIF
jgi:type II secretory pathway component PulC|tara:strand:+ start:108 stop:611 length:504 start_codon:yes stop_codon:yes gene_type:complete